MRARDPVLASSSRPRARYTHTVRAAGVEGDAQPGARLVRDRVQGQQRLAQPPVPGFREIAERGPGPGAEGPPFLGQQAAGWPGACSRPRRSTAWPRL